MAKASNYPSRYEVGEKLKYYKKTHTCTIISKKFDGKKYVDEILGCDGYEYRVVDESGQSFTLNSIQIGLYWEKEKEEDDK